MTATVQRAARSPWPAVAAIALAAIAMRAFAFSATELYADEAYYWLWSRRLAAGYFDHPPLVAWLAAAGAAVAPGELGVRWPFLACGALAIAFAALLARELAPDVPGAPGGRAALLGAALCAAAPLLHLVGAMALPDAPVAAAYTAALWLLARARGARWLLAGLAVGAALLAKYTAALLAPALLVVVLWDPGLRRDLRTRWPWLGAAVAVALFAPCLAWNARHGWVSIRFQLGHGFGANATPRSVAEYVLGQLAGAGPVALALGAAALVRARTSAWKRVAGAALLPLAVTTWAALRGRVEANWPSLVYPALAAAAGARLAGWRRASAARGLTWGSAALAAALLAIFGAEQRSPRLLAGTLAVERFHGGRALARGARAGAAEACARAACDPARPFVVPASYQVAATIAYYGGFDRLGPALERPSQLDVWGEAPAPGEAALLVRAGPSPGTAIVAPLAAAPAPRAAW